MITTLDIVIVNWNSGKLLYDCVNSLKEISQDEFQIKKIIIIDNYSTDNSIYGIDEIDLPLFIIKNSENVGFAKASNQGAKLSDSKYILFLNPDTRLYKDSLSKPINFLNNENNRKIGIVGIKLIDENNIVSKNCSSFITPRNLVSISFGLDKMFPKYFDGFFQTSWDHLDSRIVDQVMGSFFLIRRELFDNLKGYDERFFVYFEDHDLALRAKRLGFDSYYLSSTQIFHKACGTTENIKANRLFYFTKSKLIYCKKHFNLIEYTLILLVTILIEPLSRILWSLLKGSIKDVFEILKGYSKIYFNLISVNKN